MLSWFIDPHIEYSVKFWSFRPFRYSNIRPCINLIYKLAHWVFVPFLRSSAHPYILIFYHMLFWLIDPHIEYSVKFWSFRSFRYSNIQSCISLIYTLRHWVFVPCFGSSDHSYILIFNPMLSWLIDPHIEYSVKFRSFRLFRYSNIQSCISLIYTLTH
jgi:hypothetical protein